ncbi:SGNH/GDSL hydrolase family protein [Fluviispira vulneris]|uniref:SGNH/GDSL hydrolase family protein n=1 Tax=Fluviispira vulneris TaxID=2763012 RepID=UPI001645DE80|nr:SGNH/GDSL hydrolase family protein [Fluviispira vulneris]
MRQLRSSIKQVLGGRNLVGKSKDTAIQECIQEAHEKIYNKVINPTNLKKTIRICLCLENDPQKIFSSRFLENIGELNKNQNFIFRKILPRSIQKFIANFYIIYESKQKTFNGINRSYINPCTLNMNEFKNWFKSLLNINDCTYKDLIENTYIEDIFLDTAKKIKLGCSPHNKISRIVIFGDSLSDTGLMYSSTMGRIFVKLNELNKNIKILNQSPYGRFTNGFVWCDMISSYLVHISEHKNFDKYHTYEDISTNKLQKNKVDRFLLNYAVGGSTAGNYSLFKNISSLQIKTILLGTVLYCLEKQVDQYLEEYANISNNLNIIWAGPNDLVTLGWENLKGIEHAQNGLFTCINKLKARGAKNFLLINMPDIYISPKFQLASQETKNHLAWLVDKFNNDLEKKAKAENIKLFDIRQVLRDLVKNDFKYYDYEGFRYDINLTNTKDGIALLDEIKKNERYMYFDDLHPSALTHGLLGFVIAKYIAKNFEIVIEQAPPLLRRESCS